MSRGENKSMSLLGLDVGTSGCKAIVFSEDGLMLASAYQEYDTQTSGVGRAELDANAIWGIVKKVIARVATSTSADPITALAISSLGEAVVPVDKERKVIGASILNFDLRGAEYLEGLRARLDEQHLYSITGNTLGNQFSITKLMWIKEHQPKLYLQTDQFLHWSPFVGYMLGAEPVVDFSLANRSLLFDMDRAAWSEELLGIAGIDPGKLPRLTHSGTAIGKVSDRIAKELGLSTGVIIVSGAHDQCANAVGSGAIEEKHAFYGMGSYHCIAPVVTERRTSAAMIELGLNTEHHAVPRRYLSFIYNHGGTIVKWFRDIFAETDYKQAAGAGKEIYSILMEELPTRLSSVIVLPNFAPTGPPEFLTDTCGTIVGLHLNTQRGDILKGVIEGIAFYLKASVDLLPEAGITINDFRVVGGGSKSDAWVQTSADIFGQPFTRPAITEAGALGSAIMAGVGSGVFSNFQTGVEAMVRLDRIFEPDLAKHKRYSARFEEYQYLATRMKGNLKEFHRKNHLTSA
jgi:xylulokinase